MEVRDIPQTGDAAMATAELFKNWLFADRQGGTPGFMKRKAPLRILGQSEIPSRSGLFLDFPQKSSGNFVGADRRCDHTGTNSCPFRVYEIGHDRIKRYLQALLTKSEMELKLSQCKIQ